MTRFTAINLARLPPLPQTALGFDAYRAAYMADLVTRLDRAGIAYDVQGIASDTYAVTGEAFAFRTQLVAGSIDDAIAAVLLPTSWGAYLDNLGATQDPPVQRIEITPASGNTPAVMEQDDPFRARIQLAPEALSTCGPEGAYVWFALGVDDVLAAAAYGPMSFGGTKTNPFTGLGEVHIPIVSGIGDGTASPGLVAAVQAAVSSDERVPIADFVTVSPALILPWTLAATIRVGPGADPGLVQVQANARVRALADLAHRPGGAVLAQALYAALYVPDAKGAPVVGYVDLGGFVDVNPGPAGPGNTGPAYIAPWCPPDGITVSVEVVDD